jgi:hypothetical protein
MKRNYNHILIGQKLQQSLVDINMLECEGFILEHQILHEQGISLSEIRKIVEQKIQEPQRVSRLMKLIDNEILLDSLRNQDSKYTTLKSLKMMKITFLVILFVYCALIICTNFKTLSWISIIPTMSFAYVFVNRFYKNKIAIERKNTSFFRKTA